VKKGGNENRQNLKKEERDKLLEEKTKEMFENLKVFLNNEFLATTEEYKLLQQMNAVTRDKYLEMTNVASLLTKEMADLQQKYNDFSPYLTKIDEIDASVSELEKAVVLLDDYTKRLEAKFISMKQSSLVSHQKEF